MSARKEKGTNAAQRTVQYNAADVNDKLIMNLRDLGHIMRFQYEGKASQKRILIILNEVGSITQRALTERLGIQPGSASEVLAKLENAGLISRTPNSIDRRTTDIQLTDTGKTLALEAVEQRQKRHEEMFSCLSEEEKQALLSLLEKLYADWNSHFQEDRRPYEQGESSHTHHGHHGRHSHHTHHNSNSNSDQ